MTFRDNQKILYDTLNIFEKEHHDWNNSIVLLPDQVRSILTNNNPQIECNPIIDVKNMDSFTMAHTHFMDDRKHSALKEKYPLVLNFANPVSPGGGVRRGARAQEEDLCRRSNLLPYLESKSARDYYIYNRSLMSNMGSDAIILTPQVDVIKDENYELLDEPYAVSVLTCAAPMVCYGLSGVTQKEYEKLFYNRIVGIMRVAACYGYTNIVLGAWGCGAFGNDPALVSELFKRAILENGHYFAFIDFAVLDHSLDKHNLTTFQKALSNLLSKKYRYSESYHGHT